MCVSASIASLGTSILVPNFTDSLKYAVVSGAVAGGGLTIIANAPNPAGQSILKGTPFEGALVRNGIDQTSVEGANTLPYAIPNMTVDLHTNGRSQMVLHQRLVRLGETDLPGKSGVLDRGQRRSTGTTVMPGDQDHVRFGLRHTRRDGPDARL